MYFTFLEDMAKILVLVSDFCITLELKKTKRLFLSCLIGASINQSSNNKRSNNVNFLKRRQNLDR